jgi:hypothetical protein
MKIVELFMGYNFAFGPKVQIGPYLAQITFHADHLVARHVPNEMPRWVARVLDVATMHEFKLSIAATSTLLSASPTQMQMGDLPPSLSHPRSLCLSLALAPQPLTRTAVAMATIEHLAASYACL